MELTQMVKDQSRAERLCGIGTPTKWTWRYYRGAELAQTETPFCTAPRCEELSQKEWESVKAQGCTRLEIYAEITEGRRFHTTTRLELVKIYS